MTQLSKNLRNLGVLLCAVIFTLVISFITLAVWNDPTVDPPGNNVDLPINVGELMQKKEGSLGLGGLQVNYGALLATESGNVGIGVGEPEYKLDVNGEVQAVAYFHSSDIRLKENIKPLENSLSKVLRLNGISYNLKENGEKSLGFSAQEVRKIFPEVVSENKEGMLSINSVGLIAPLVEAVKEQQDYIRKQDVRINILEKELELLKK